MSYSIYKKDNNISSFFAVADQAMYKDKQQRKSVHHQLAKEI